MRFEILGPLQVHDGERPVEVTGARLRVLLAALAVRAGQVVPAGELAELVWDGAPPDGAVRTLRSHVMRLRRALGPLAGPRLVTRYPGYVIEAVPDEADVLAFGVLCQECSAAASAGAWDRVAAVAGEALELWRGEPLADVASQALVAVELPRLTRMRLQVLELHGEAGLRLGHHGGLVPRLQERADEHPLHERFHAQLMLALYRSGRQADALQAYQVIRGALASELGADPGPELQELHQRILTADPRLAAPPERETAAVLLAGTVGGAVSPYRGLRAFGEHDAAFFFGRETAADQVLERMSRCLDGTGLCVVSGVSGAGKTSLLHAGVLPALRRSGLPSAPQAAAWPTLAFTPGHAPLDELAVQIAPLVRADAATVRQALATDPAALALTARQAARGNHRPPAAPGTDTHGPRLLLIVDQFEQLFTMCPDEAQRRAFITALHAAATIRQGREQVPAAIVVLGVRADFEAYCADYPQLADAVQDRYLVRPMTERQLHMVITSPAGAAGTEVDTNLVDTLIREVTTRSRPGWAGTTPGVPGAAVLPLLSHALDQAWRHRRGTTLSLADYERTGGIEQAIASSAQRAYDQLTPAQQQAARQVFTRLTALSPDGIDAAVPATRADLTDGKTPTQAQDVTAVLEAFAAERLLTLAADTVEISHEALLTAWPLLRGTWLAETHADRLVLSQLRSTATEWARHSRDPSYLYRGTLLQSATRISAGPAHTTPLTQAERDFLRASGQASRRTGQRRRGAIAALLTLTVIAATAAGVGQYNAASASRQHAIALSRQLAADSLTTDLASSFTAWQLAAAAWGVFPTSQAKSAMITLLAQQQTQGLIPVSGAAVGVDKVVFSPNGKLLATLSGDSTVQLWDPATGERAGKPLHVKAAPQRALDTALAFSPNGKLLATASRTVRLWNPATGRPAGKPLTGAGSTSGIAFSPDGEMLAASDAEGVVLWNLAAGDRVVKVLRIAEGAEGVAFSPNGKLLASADLNGTIQLWQPATGRPAGKPLRVSNSPAGVVTSVAFSPNSKLLASTDLDGTVQLWHAATGQPAGKPFHASAAFGAAFSPSGKLLATTGGGIARVWNLAAGHPAGTPLHVNANVNAAAFSPSGKLLATANSNGMVQLWNPGTGQPASTVIRAVPNRLDSLDGVTFSHSGRLLATTDATNGTVQLWNPATGQATGKPLAANPVPQDSRLAAAFSPDGSLLATVDAGGTVRLWNPATQQAAGMPLHVANGGQTTGAPAPFRRPGDTNLIAFSPNGRLLASGAPGGTVQLWEPAAAHPAYKTLPAINSRISAVTSVAFSPNGALLATAGFSGTVQLWNPRTGKPAGAPMTADSPASGGVNGIAFSPDGKLLATADANGTVRLWNPATSHPVGTPLPADPGGSVNGIAFSPDGKLLASADSDGTVWLWNLTTAVPAGGPIPADTGPSGGVAGVAFSPNGKLLASADGNGTVQIWKVPPLANPYATLCADTGPPTRHVWNEFAPGEPFPKICG